MTTAHKVAEGVELDKYWQDNREGAYAYYLGRNPPADTDRNVLRLDAHADDGTVFEIRATGDRVIPMEVDLQPNSRGSGPLYMPMHRSCLTVADHFIGSMALTTQSSQSQDGIRITSIKQLWEVIYRRVPGSWHCSTWVPPEPHDYFGGRSCRNVDYEPGDDEEFAKVQSS